MEAALTLEETAFHVAGGGVDLRYVFLLQAVIQQLASVAQTL